MKCPPVYIFTSPWFLLKFLKKKEPGIKKRTREGSSSVCTRMAAALSVLRGVQRYSAFRQLLNVAVSFEHPADVPRKVAVLLLL